jgi:hypothetical protein
MASDPVARLRTLCLALPEVTERPSHGEIAFFVRDKKQFVMVDDHHHGAEHLGFWCAARAGAQEALIAADADRYFRPPYVGHRGWVGVRLAAAGLAAPDWAEIDEVVRDAYRTVAPRSLSGRL